MAMTVVGIFLAHPVLMKIIVSVIITNILRQDKLEIDGKPVGECSARTNAYVRTHVRTDGWTTRKLSATVRLGVCSK